MINKRKIHDELIEAFMVYQHRLDQPFPDATETSATIRLKYMSDPIFHAKVKSLASGVMHILDKHVSEP